MKCPRDQTALRIDEVTHRDAYLCHDCHGIFLGLCEIPEQYRISEQGKADLKHSDLRCPACLVPMRELRYKRHVIDLCIPCQSIWLDLGEHEQFAEQLSRIKKKSGTKIPDQVVDASLDFLFESAIDYTIEALSHLMD